MKAKQDLFNYDGHINTASGIKFSLFDPKPEQINIEDIAKGLAYKGHFGGQTPKYFSIADHCIMVFALIPEAYPIDIKLAALLHDASEAYIGDMIKPLKIHLPLFQKIEEKILRVIFKKFDISYSLLNRVKYYDTLSQSIEFSTFYEGNTSNISYWSPEQSKDMFLYKFHELMRIKEKSKVSINWVKKDTQ